MIKEKEHIGIDTGSNTKNFGTIIPFILLIGVMTMGAATTIMMSDRAYIMANWSDFRCKVGPLFTASLYKPSDDSRTSGEFAKDNFSFCMKQFQSEGINAAFSPAVSILDNQIDAAKTVQDNQNTSKQVLHNLLDSTVGKVLATFYEQFKNFGQNVANIFQRLKMGYNRIEAVLLSVVYAGISMMKAILNGIDFVILVVLIILLILVVLIILLFFFMFYSIPVILITISALVSVGIGVGHMANTFCFKGDTKIKTISGDNIYIKDLQIGDILKGGGRVDGLYVFDGNDTILYDISGIKVSGDHIIWDSTISKWISVEEYKGAIKSNIKTDRVYCPTISNRCIPVVDNSYNTVWFRDWEEMNEYDIEGYTKWDKMVNEILNGCNTYTQNQPTEINAFGEGIYVIRDYCDIVPINEIKIGDKVLSKNNIYVTVTGLYKERVNRSTDRDWIGDGVWINQDENEGKYQGNINKWIHPAKNTTNCTELYGWNLVTETGEFMIVYKGERKLVRDALEIGADGIKETYNFVKDRLR